jgi:hypothetical protein
VTDDGTECLLKITGFLEQSRPLARRLVRYVPVMDVSARRALEDVYMTRLIELANACTNEAKFSVAAALARMSPIRLFLVHGMQLRP